MAAAWLAALAAMAGPAAAATPPDPAPTAFEHGLALDLGHDPGHGGKPDPVGAFRAYLRAAELGLPQAEFNVAVMYDSGRGVAPDPAAAARWYAAAAAGGLRRAAYNLGEIYEQGDGVKRDKEAARAWFAMAARQGVAAARPRLRDRALKQSGADIGKIQDAPTPLSPPDGDIVALSGRPCPFVWRPPASGGHVAYVVQVTMPNAGMAGFVFTGDTDVTAIRSTLPLPMGHYAWRVFAVQDTPSRVTQSGWTRFSISDFMPSAR